jgi:hypothetical protein
MQTITTIGLDIAKSAFQVHGVDAGGQVVIRRAQAPRVPLPCQDLVLSRVAVAGRPGARTHERETPG